MQNIDYGKLLTNIREWSQSRYAPKNFNSDFIDSLRERYGFGGNFTDKQKNALVRIARGFNLYIPKIKDRKKDSYDIGRYVECSICLHDVYAYYEEYEETWCDNCGEFIGEDVRDEIESNYYIDVLRYLEAENPEYAVEFKESLGIYDEHFWTYLEVL